MGKSEVADRKNERSLREYEPRRLRETCSDTTWALRTVLPGQLRQCSTEYEQRDATDERDLAAVGSQKQKTEKKF